MTSVYIYLSGKKMHFQFRTFSELKIKHKNIFLYSITIYIHEFHTFGMIATPNTSLILFIMAAILKTKHLEFAPFFSFKLGNSYLRRKSLYGGKQRSV